MSFESIEAADVLLENVVTTLPGFVALEHVGSFNPIAIPAATEDGWFELLSLEDVARFFPGVGISPIYFYRTPMPVRTEELGSIRDCLEAVVSWLPFFRRTHGGGLREASVRLIEEVAARKGLIAYLIHQQWGLALGSPDVSSGNQVLSTHNKNPLTHFDLDTVYYPSTIVEVEETSDPESLIQAQIEREVGWLVRDIRHVAQDILLSGREIMRATALFYHVLLADLMAGTPRSDVAPREDSPLIIPAV
jgi:hypothetical protein